MSGRIATGVTVAVGAVYGLLGLGAAASALVLLWNVEWSQKWTGLVLLLLGTASLFLSWVNLYLLRHPPTFCLGDHEVTIRAWPILGDPLTFSRDEVDRIDHWTRGQDVGRNVAVLTAPYTLANAVVRLTCPRRLPTRGFVPTLVRWMGTPVDWLVRNVGGKRRYDGIGVNIRPGVEVPEDWRYSLR